MKKASFCQLTSAPSSLAGRSFPARGQTWRQLLFFLPLLLAGVTSLSTRAEIVYDNTKNYLTNSFASKLEFGDEITLSVASTNITDFFFEYNGNFNPFGTETVRVRFYKNDGADIDPGVKVILGPGTLLYDSGRLPIAPGLNVMALSGLAVTVPKSFTWTVLFEGIVEGVDESAALLFYNPPTVGKSFDDYWVNAPEGWRLERFDGQPVANFGSRLERNDAILTVSTPRLLADGANELQINGPVGRRFMLEFSTNSIVWTPVATNTLVNGSVAVLHPGAANSVSRFYRASLLPVLLELASVEPLAAGLTRIRFSGPIGEIFEVQSSSDFQSWTTVTSAVIPAGTVDVFDESPSGAFRFYRVQLVNPPRVALANFGGFFNGLFVVQLGGPPGRRVLVQSSSDHQTWTTVSTNVLSFFSGVSQYVDKGGTNTPHRFFRAFLD